VFFIHWIFQAFFSSRVGVKETKGVALSREHHGSDTVAYTETDPPRGSTGQLACQSSGGNGIQAKLIKTLMCYLCSWWCMTLLLMRTGYCCRSRWVDDGATACQGVQACHQRAVQPDWKVYLDTCHSWRRRRGRLITIKLRNFLAFVYILSAYWYMLSVIDW